LSETFSDAELEAAVVALGDPERFREAESVVARAAPGLQKVLAVALAEGGWFGESHEDEVRKLISGSADDEARLIAIRTLLAEEARMGMMIGVAVGWALFDELQKPKGGQTPFRNDPEEPAV
jgi:hypothetical protein